MMSGKFIVIEGADSSGKKTQTSLLVNKLKQLGNEVESIYFPTYQDTPLGVFVAKYLKGDFGNKEDITPEIGSLFYTIDRYQFKDKLKEKLASGKIIIADRYTTSNIFQAAKLSGEERFELWEWVKIVESRIPQPDINIFLNVSVEIGDQINKKQDVKNDLLKKGEKDIHEKDLNYMERTRKLYLEIAKKENWIIIECIKNGQLRSREDISDEIFKQLVERKII